MESAHFEPEPGAQAEALPVEILLPAQQSMMMLVRLSVYGLISKERLDWDSMEDIKAAAAEACFCMMQQPQRYRRLRVRYERTRPGLRVCIEGVEPTCEGGRIPQKYQQVAISILETMMDRVTPVECAGGLAAIAMEKNFG